jgi:hypothetical protein
LLEQHTPKLIIERLNMGLVLVRGLLEIKSSFLKLGIETVAARRNGCVIRSKTG